MTLGVRPLPVVVDTSVALAWLLPDEPWHGQALAFARDIADTRLAPSIAPNLGFEARTGLLRAVRRGRLEWEDLELRLDILVEMALEVPDVGYPDHLLIDLCRRHGLSWGDAHHAHLARTLGAPLVTADLRLVRALASADVTVASISDRPGAAP